VRADINDASVCLLKDAERMYVCCVLGVQSRKIPRAETRTDFAALGVLAIG
jgi:hypothetical protein